MQVKREFISITTEGRELTPCRCGGSGFEVWDKGFRGVGA